MIKLVSYANYDHAPERAWKHLDTMQYKTFMKCRLDLLKATKNQTKTALLMRCGFNIVNRILHVSTQRGMTRRNFSQVVCDQLRIVEKSFRKGHHYITVLGHPKSGCVLDVGEDRTKEEVKSLLNKY